MSSKEVCSGDKSFFSYWKELTDGQQKTVIAITFLATLIIAVVSTYYLTRNASIPSHTSITPNGETILARTTASPNGAMQQALHINNSMGIDEARAAYKKLLEEAIKAGEDVRKAVIEKGFCSWDQLDSFLDRVQGLNNIPYTPTNYPWDIFWNNRFQAWGTFPNMHVDLAGLDKMLNLLKSINSGIL